MASPRWVIGHLLLTAAFAVLPAGLEPVYLRLADGPAGPRALPGDLAQRGPSALGWDHAGRRPRPWLPLLPRAVRVADGFLIVGVGGLGLARGLWRGAARGSTR